MSKQSNHRKAEALGWSRTFKGRWTHPRHGVVTKSARGRWLAYQDDAVLRSYKGSGLTMLEVMRLSEALSVEVPR